jgi:hypothetical protein
MSEPEFKQIHILVVVPRDVVHGNFIGMTSRIEHNVLLFLCTILFYIGVCNAIESIGWICLNHDIPCTKLGNLLLIYHPHNIFTLMVKVEFTNGE